MWIIRCTDTATHRRFDVGPFGSDDRAEQTAVILRARSGVAAEIELLIEPARALAGARF